MSEPFILGVNYWPRRRAMYWWSNFDADEVREEFAVIHSLGMTVVRIFLLWDDWQPTADTVSVECLRNLGKVLDAAVEHGLGLDITFFTGHMSGPNWTPGWLRDGKPTKPENRQLVSGGKLVDGWYRNFFTDAQARNAQRLLLSTVVAEYHNDPGIWMWNLGNEPDLFAIAPDQATGTGWLAEMTDVIKAIDPDHPVTCGLHAASLYSDQPLRIDKTFTITDVAVMHSYPMYVSWMKNPLDPQYVPFTCALTTTLCGKPTLMEEFGGCTVAPGEPSQVWEWLRNGEPIKQFMASEADFANYIEQTLPNLIDAGATGAMLWCYADYSIDLWNKPPLVEYKHERHFGLVRPDGTLKPHAEVIKQFAAKNPVVLPAKRSVQIDADTFYANPAAHTERLFYEYVK
jgi:endo-1,4-beta-mannosidase